LKESKTKSKEVLQITSEEQCMCIRVNVEQYISEIIGNTREDKRCRIN